MDGDYVRSAAECLSEQFLFTDCDFFSLDAAHSVTDRCDVRQYNDGDAVMPPFSDKPSLYVVVSGKVRIESRVKNKVLLKYAYPGEVFGAAYLFGDISQAPSARVEKSAEIISIPKDLITELLASEPKVALNYISFLSDRIFFLNKKIVSFTAGTAEDKLIFWLIGAECSNDEVNVLSMSSLASQLGIGRASLYRAADDLSARGYITYDANCFRILDRRSLEEAVGY